MLILIASENAAATRALAEHLASQERHRVLTAQGMDELAKAAASLDKVDVLLFSAAFSQGRGKELRDGLRMRFPALQTAMITDEGGNCVSPGQVSDWLDGLENAAAAPHGNPAATVWLGDHELREKLGATATTDSFRAVQRSVNREVILERLKPELQGDRQAVREFRAMVRARANVNCPLIASVYEAQESDGALFYTREMVKGKNLDQLKASHTTITPEESLHLLRAAGEAMMWFTERNQPREPLGRHHLYHGSDGAPRIANIAASAATPVDERAEILAVADGLLRVTDLKVSPAAEFSHVTGLMKASGPHRLTTWRAVLREARAGLQRLTEARTSALGAERDTARPRRRTSRAPLIAGIVAVACGGIAAAWYATQSKPAEVRRIPWQVYIPGGEFTFRESTRKELPDFWIDSHEVTIGQYAAFLTATAGGSVKEFDHPDQPKDKTGHEPKEWAEIIAAARAGGTWKSYPVSLRCPVFNVDWWDAFAYARWKGRRLPTGEEWEKAARGPNGRKWPWGSEADPARANTGADYSPQPGNGKGAIDGYVWWCEVDAMPDDVSAYEVYGMAGNVSEWTASSEPDPNFPDKKLPVFRGGDFSRMSPAAVTTPWLAKGPSYTQPFLGFRTVTSSPPAD